VSQANRPAVPAAPLEKRQALFLVEDGEQWTGERILALAARVPAALPAKSDASSPVGVCSPSAGFVLASVLALWKLGRQPLLLDPNLRKEPEGVLARWPGLSVVTSVPGLLDGRSIHVTEAPGGAALEPVWPSGEQTAALFFTSGSTGEPKIISKTARQLFLQMEAELTWLGVPTDLSVYCLAPPFHILGFVYGLFLPMLGRGRAAYSPQALPAQWVASIHEQRPSLVVGVPYQYKVLAAHAKEPLPKAFYFTSGAPMTPDIDGAFRERTGQSVTQGYGSTETGGIAKRTDFGAWHPFPGLEWKIAEDGRLVVRSPWQEKPGEWHVCDDVVSAEGDGFVLLGRADSVVKVAGKRFSTDEIVRAAMAVPGVGECVAVVYERFGENAVALFATCAQGGTTTATALREALGTRLAPFKVPRTIEVVAELPRLSNAKVDRQALRHKAEQHKA
jgi:acyl-coenzyme A synthetase/AMP-(fatty) acid ligase